MIDVTQLAAAVTAGKNALDLVKSLAELLPGSDKKSAIEGEIDRANRIFDMVEYETAASLGYKLCHCSYPPQIMLLPNNGPKSEWECSKCGRKSNLHRAINVSNPGHI